MRHDLLDQSNNNFDRDTVEFNVEVSHLDSELQAYLDDKFERFKNIEHSLRLLRKFETTIKRESLKATMASKYNFILKNFSLEIESVQKVFTDEKAAPPIVRNMPPDAGRIIWCRHLFQKITGPISMFPENVINGQEIKKYYNNYNMLGK